MINGVRVALKDINRLNMGTPAKLSRINARNRVRNGTEKRSEYR